jgi:hypothetical protein
MSPQSQNQLIFACFHVLQKEIVQEVNNARYFTLLADETTDAAHLEQLSICVRYKSDYYSSTLRPTSLEPLWLTSFSVFFDSVALI